MTSNLLYRMLDQVTSQEEIICELNHLDQAGWDNLLDKSMWHGIKPLIYSRLKPLFGKAAIPTSIQNDLRDSYLRSARKNILILHHAASLLSALKAREIDVIGLKGIYLVENIYDNIAARPFSDIDIMVSTEDIKSTISVLQELGFAMNTYFNVHDENIDIKHVPPMFNDDDLPVEIHWTILEEDEPFTIDAQGLWDRSVPVKIAAVDALALSPEDLILHLCLHLGYQHRFKLGLRGLYDIDEVLRHFEGQVNWRTLVKIAQDWGSERVTWLTLTLVGKLLGAEIPPYVINILQPDSVEPWIWQAAKTQLLDPKSRRIPMTPDLADLAVKKCLLSRFRLIISRVFIPRQTLARLYGVPPTSIHIYGCYFKRFCELVRMYGGVVRRIQEKGKGIQVAVENENMMGELKAWLGDK